MRNIDEDDRSRQAAHVCVMDRKARDVRNIPLWSKAKQMEGQRLKTTLQGIFIRSRTYLNYNEQFITVKVDKPSLKDKLEQDAAWQQMERHCARNNIEIDATPANILFHIKP
jgi:hypothetical protein